MARYDNGRHCRRRCHVLLVRPRVPAVTNWNTFRKSLENTYIDLYKSIMVKKRGMQNDIEKLLDDYLDRKELQNNRQAVA